MTLTQMMRFIYTKDTYDWILHVNFDSFSVYGGVCGYISMTDDVETSRIIAENWDILERMDNVHQLILVHSLVPKRPLNQVKNPMWVKKGKVADDVLELLYERIQYSMGYSEREFNHVKPIITKEINKDVKKWLQNFAIDTKDKKYKGVING